jgi:hypothetical protein
LTNPGTLITAKGYTYSLLEGLPVTPAALQGWLNNAPANGSNPKAYVNWILLDEQMKPVTGASGFDAVGALQRPRYFLNKSSGIPDASR